MAANDIDNHIRQNYSWAKLPSSLKQALGNNPGHYNKQVLEFSIKNQQRWRGNLVKQLVKDEKKYYEKLLNYSREHLMLYPYHLQDMLVRGLRVTPFSYYSNMMFDIMSNEKSYDSLPNFTAADVVRLLGVGRNQYIDSMNLTKSKKFFRRRGIKDVLPSTPVLLKILESWWRVHVGYVTEDDVRSCSPEEHKMIDDIIDNGHIIAGKLNRNLIIKLYTKGFVYLQIPIHADDYIVVPPLKGFVMNRVTGDYFETLLYKIFVSIDEHTSMSELAGVLQIDIDQIKMAVSVFIRLGFAHKKNDDVDQSQLHPSWSNIPSPHEEAPPELLTSPLLPNDFGRDFTSSPEGDDAVESIAGVTLDHQKSVVSTSGTFQKRIGFLFDSTLTAFLMMGNLSPGLKNHAVTMFEVGKLTDESLDSFISELSKVGSQAEGEAKRYFEHAVTLRDTVQFLRRNQKLFPNEECGLGIDLLRCESLHTLDDATATRILQRNYWYAQKFKSLPSTLKLVILANTPAFFLVHQHVLALLKFLHPVTPVGYLHSPLQSSQSVLVSMAPLSQEIRSVTSCCPPHLGPPIPEVNSIWFKLWLYTRVRCGPPSILLTKGTRVKKFPAILKGCKKVLMTSWGHDGAIVSVTNLLITLNDALTHSAVLVQAHGWQSEGESKHISFPFDNPTSDDDILNHPCLLTLGTEVDLKHMCGFITMLKIGIPHITKPTRSKKPAAVRNNISSEAKAQRAEIDEFLHDLKELGIGGMESEPQTPTDVSESSIGMEHKNGITTSNSIEVDSGPLMEWVPLEMSIGIPLFSGDINKAVCQKILDYHLFHEDSLEKQIHTSRLLALDVMNFIAEYNVPNSEVDPVENNVMVPLPARNLQFDGKTLKNFDCR